MHLDNLLTVTDQSVTKAKRDMENTREQIISSAFSFYTKPEINNVSLSAIAARAGITKPAIYRHFKSRQELEQVLEDRVYSEIYSVLSKITFKKDEGTLALIEDVVVLLLTHKEYLFYLISNQNDFSLDEAMFKLKDLGLPFFDSVFATDGSVTNMEKYKMAVYLGCNVLFFVILRNRVLEELNRQDTYSDVLEFASKIEKFLRCGLGQNISNFTVSRLATLDENCQSNMKLLKPVNKIFVSVSEIVKEKGLRGITVESVAHGIGLAKSSIYTKFENKTQMIGSLIQEEFEEMFKFIKDNSVFAENNAERIYVLMETVLIYFMKKPEVLTVGKWFQFHSFAEIVNVDKYEERVYNDYFKNIEFYDAFPDFGLPVQDKRIVVSWLTMMPVVLYRHAKTRNISPEVVQAMLKDILIMMETGVGKGNEK